MSHSSPHSTSDNLAPLAALRVEGPDAKTFLQGQLTCDLNEATTGTLLLGAHCNIKGRIVASFYVQANPEGFSLILPHGTLPILKKQLGKYALFSKVTLTESILSQDEIQKLMETADWEAALIKKGVAMIYPETSEQFTPHDLNYPALGGVSFQKGCYIGQEIIARMEHRGKAESNLYLARTQTPLPRNTKLHAENDEKTLGHLIAIAPAPEGFNALVVLNRAATAILSDKDTSLDLFAGNACMEIFL